MSDAVYSPESFRAVVFKLEYSPYSGKIREGEATDQNNGECCEMADCLNRIFIKKPIRTKTERNRGRRSF